MNPLRIITMKIEPVIQAMSGNYAVRGKLSDADCVVGFAFGYRGKSKTRTPGLSNQDLANVIMNRFPDLPKILQLEIADAIKEAGGAGTKDILVISKRRSRDHAMAAHELDTQEVAQQAKELMDSHGWKKAVLVAHPNHMPRVQEVCSKVGIDWVATDDLKGAVEFDPLSSQKWTRSIDKWRGYEPIALMYYRAKGWV